MAFRQSSKKRFSLKDIIKPVIYSVSTVCLVVAAISFSSFHNKDDKSFNSVASVTANATKDDASVKYDKVATSVAANFALESNMPVAKNVSNLSSSIEAKQAIVASEDYNIVKPQIVQPGSSSKEILMHKVAPGEDVNKIATQYKLNPDTIRWANGITGDSVSANTDLVVPPVDGVVYNVKDGDTAASLAQKYSASADRILSFNNIGENVEPGQRIVIPGGVPPENERPGYQSPEARALLEAQSRRSIYSNGSALTPPSANFNASAGNRYAFGNCTYYVYERRPDVGSFWGNATSWAASARAAGFTVVQGVPKAGSIFQYGGGYGHVGIVESVDEASGTMQISDMNGIAGFNRVGYKTIPINHSWNYIY